MTLSTHHRSGLRRFQVVGAGIALATGLGVLALTGQSSYGTDGTRTAYTRPTPALHGQSLATYLRSHYDDRVEREEHGR
jgi:hypothetical protein